jgi:hypothetical protein
MPIVAAAQTTDVSRLELVKSERDVRITLNGEPLATYVFADPAITRPYFAHVRAPGGTQVTRNQPPIAGQDLVDHPTFHPGIWLAFGDVSGADDWRLVAPVHNVSVEEGISAEGGAKFVARHEYHPPSETGHAICEELFVCEIKLMPQGYLIAWDSTFTSGSEFKFGDQEEMGLGLRVATPIRASRTAEAGVPAGNGEIRDAAGRVNEAGVWGQSADWCDYSGVIGGERVGMTIFCHPQNFRPSWFHARDRGLLVANAFGRAAFRQGEKSEVVVKPGESLRLRYGIFVHATPEGEAAPDLAEVYRQYVEFTAHD